MSVITLQPVVAQEAEQATDEAVATQEAEVFPDIATASGLLEFPPIDTSNIATLTDQEPNHLLELVESQSIGPLSPFNFMRHMIRSSIARGMSINTVVFLLLFPLIALLIAISRHIIGLTGLSMYAPAALSVVLLSLGILDGSILFFTTIVFAAIARYLFSAFKLQYMPRTALMVWFVSLGVFSTILFSTTTALLAFIPVNVFSILILILLSENFIEVQAQRTKLIAFQRAAETYILALICALLLGAEIIQVTVLLFPELFLLLIAASNILVGKYLGLRLAEWLRFKPIMDHEE